MSYHSQGGDLWNYGQAELGAVAPADWSRDRYADTARTAAAAMIISPFVFVGIGKNGSPMVVTPASTLDDLATIYDEKTTRPGNLAYVAMFDKTDPELEGGPRDEAFFVATSIAESFFSRLKEPWVLLGFVGLVGASIYYKGKPKRRRPRARGRR